MDNDYKEYAENKETNKDISLRDIFDFIAYNWYWFALSLIVFAGAGYVYAKILPRQYQAKATIFVDDEYSRSINSDITEFRQANRFVRTGGGVENEMFILRSRTLMNKVVDNTDANIRYFNKAKLRNVETSRYAAPVIMAMDTVIKPYQLQLRLGADGYDAVLSYAEEGSGRRHEAKFGAAYGDTLSFAHTGPFAILKKDANVFDKYIESAGNYLRINVSNPMRTAQSYANRLAVNTAAKNTSIVGISLTDPVAVKAADIVNDLIRVYNDDAVEGKRQTARATMAFLNDRISSVEVELDAIDTHIERFKRDNESVNIESEFNVYLNSASRYQEQLMGVVIQVDLIESIADFLNNKTMSLLPVDLGIEDSGLNNGIAKYNELIFQRKRMTGEYAGDNPVVKEMDAQIALMNASLKESLENVHRSLLTKKKSLESQIDKLSGKVGDIPAFERESMSIMRNHDIKSTLFSFLLTKREETGLKMVATAPIAKIVDPALTNHRPVAPRTTLIITVFCIIGLMLPAIIIFLSEQLRIKIARVSEIEDSTQVPILATIPSKDPGAKTDIIVGPNSRDVVSEAFRMLRTNLDFVLPPGGKVIMFTSSIPGEGKSFSSINLALSLAITGKKVVLVDLDLRKGTLADRISGKKESRGMINYLIRKTDDIGTLIVTGAVHSVDVLYSGILPPNPSELLIGERMDTLFDELRKRYDYIVVDTPPVGLVTDSILVNRVADLTLFAVRIGHSYKRGLQSLELFRKRKIFKNPGIVVTDTGASRSYTQYGKYSSLYGGYGYGYGYGYEVKSEKKHDLKYIFRKIVGKKS